MSTIFFYTRLRKIQEVSPEVASDLQESERTAFKDLGVIEEHGQEKRSAPAAHLRRHG